MGDAPQLPYYLLSDSSVFVLSLTEHPNTMSTKQSDSISSSSEYAEDQLLLGMQGANEYGTRHTVTGPEVRESGVETDNTHVGEIATGSSDAETRRLAGSSLCTDEDAPHGMFIFVPILMILMLVLFMYRKPVLNYLSGKATPSYKGLRIIQKKAPVRH